MSSNYNEILARLPEIARVVNLFDSESVQQKAFDLLADSIGASVPKTPTRKASKETPKAPEKASPGKRRKKASGPSLVGDLNLRPKTGTTWKDFIEDKKPRNNYEKSTVAVYYLAKHLGVDAVTADHVYTAYKDAGWKVPTNLPNQLQVVASKKGWLSTSNMADVKVTIAGENVVDHDLPHQPKK